LQAASLGKKIVNPTATFLKGDVLAVLGKLPKAKYDLIVTSPPYNIRKIYERSAKLTFEQYIEWLDSVIAALIDTLPKHGSICWQVGTFIKDGEVFPLDIHTYDSFKRRGMKLRKPDHLAFQFWFALKEAIFRTIQNDSLVYQVG
jgi:adenine-specific DNA-methyltransferase